MCQINFKAKFLKAYLKLLNFRNLLQVASMNFYGYNKRFLFPVQSL